MKLFQERIDSKTSLLQCNKMAKEITQNLDIRVATL